jgi:mRNA-degrading endonuclease toxin of MazEF toxin-antitoxin module
MIRRGDVVIVEIPFTDVPGAKKRPSLVVQSDIYNQSIRKTVVTIFTGNLRRKGDPSHLYVDPATPEGAKSGLNGPSLASCYNLFTVEQDRIEQVIGHLSDIFKQQMNDCLKAALGIP